MNVKDWDWGIWVSVRGCPLSFCLAAIRLCSRLWSPGISCSKSPLPSKHTLYYLQGSATGMPHWRVHLCHTVNVSDGSHKHHLHGDDVKCNKRPSGTCKSANTQQQLRAGVPLHHTPRCMRAAGGGQSQVALRKVKQFRQR